MVAGCIVANITLLTEELRGALQAGRNQVRNVQYMQNNCIIY